MSPSPTFFPVIANGRDVSFASVTVTGPIASTGVATATMLSGVAPGDTFDRVRMREDGRIDWGPGNGARDTNLYRNAPGSLTTDGYFVCGAGQSNGSWTLFGGSLVLGTAGVGIQVKEGANACQGAATLVAGTVTVATNKVTATSRIQLTPQSLGTVASPKTVGVTARTAGVSFTITSADPTDTSVVAWEIFEPAA